MIYNPGLLYRILDKYIENRMDEEEHGFVAAVKWPDSYRLGKCSEKFWAELQEVYDICILESERNAVVAVGDLKRLITSGY